MEWVSDQGEARGRDYVTNLLISGACAALVGALVGQTSRAAVLAGTGGAVAGSAYLGVHGSEPMGGLAVVPPLWVGGLTAGACGIAFLAAKALAPNRTREAAAVGAAVGALYAVGDLNFWWGQ